MSESALAWGVVFGSVGLGYFLYGRKQSRILPYFCGLGLMIVPYFIDGPLLLVAAGALMMALPFFVRL